MNLTRRAALGGLALLPASTGATLAASAMITESPRDRCMRLANELSYALEDVTDFFDDWCLRVGRPINGTPNVYAEPIISDPIGRVRRHRFALLSALQEAHGGRWTSFDLTPGHSTIGVLFHNCDNGAPQNV